MSDEEDKHDENIDALRALGGSDEPADALAAMAAGDVPAAAADASAGEKKTGPDEEGAEHDTVDDQAAALAAAAMGPVDQAAELAAVAQAGTDAATPAGGLAPATPAFSGAAAPPSAQDKRVRAVRMQAQSRRVYAYQFKRTMIPLLMVVGVLLLIVGLISAAYLPSGGPDAGQKDIEAGATEAPTRNPVAQRYRPWLVLSAFVVGTILLVGAWMFYADVKRSDMKEAAMRAREAEEREPSRPEEP